MENHKTVNCPCSAIISEKPKTPCKTTTAVSGKTTYASAKWETAANDQDDDSSCTKETSEESSEVESTCRSDESFLNMTAYNSHSGGDRSKSVCNSSNETKSSTRSGCLSDSDSGKHKDDTHSESAKDHSNNSYFTPNNCAQQADVDIEDVEKPCCAWSLDEKSTKQFCATQQNNFSLDHGRTLYSQSAASCRPMIQRVYRKRNGQNASIKFNKKNKSQICLMQNDTSQKKKYI